MNKIEMNEKQKMLFDACLNLKIKGFTTEQIAELVEKTLKEVTGGPIIK